MATFKAIVKATKSDDFHAAYISITLRPYTS